MAGEYRARLEARREVANRLERGHERFSWLRLAIAAGVALSFALGGLSAWPAALALLAAFAGVAYAHAQLLNRRDRARRAIDFYVRGIARLEDRWQGDGDPGDRFSDAEHPSADDIDLFGPGSLFQLLSTPRTRGGEARLAAWLKAPAPPAEVRARQQAVRELAPRLDFREDVFVIGPDVRSAVDTDALTRWASSPPMLPALWPLAVLPVLVLATASAIAVWISQGEPPAWLVPAAAVQLAAGAWFHRRVMAVIGGIHWRVRELRVLASLLERLGHEPVAAGRLGPLAAALNATGHSPAAEVRRLARLADLVVSRENQLFAPLAALLMVATQGAILIDRWRARCGAQVPAWIDAASEYEALLALAEFAADNPDVSYPELVEGAPLFEADSMNHPLLPRDRAVANTVRLGGQGPRVLLVSGSNMSGKSTLLRTVGITAALAQAGAPVLATRARISPLDIGATLRIQDSLQEGRSRFFAEITRVSQVVGMARAAAADPSRPGVLFLLDEVLSGTNSHDRRQGAEGVIRGLATLGAIGLVTTHDLALTDAVGSADGAIVNVHFEDRFEDGVLHFDYRLRPGVVRTSNAIALMRSVGLDV